MSPILGIWASAQQPALNPSVAYESIATTTVGSGGSSTITFSSIPSTYKHLQLRWLARCTNADTFNAIQIRFNSDTGSNYAYHSLRGTGTAADAGAASTQSLSRLGWTLSANQTANSFGAGVTDVLDYADTNKYKVARTLGGGDANGSGWVFLESSLWMSTSAINTITLTMDAGNFAQYSSFALYGIKGA